MQCLLIIIAALYLASLSPLSAQTLASTPPLAWNSWDAYGYTITEPQFKANVDWMDQHLKRYGWQYAVIDEGWYLSNPESGKPQWHYILSGNGLYMPATNRFPSAGLDAGLKPMADYAHMHGLKFGIHILRGIPREAVGNNLAIAASPYHAADAADRSDVCAWNPDNYGLKLNEAGQAYYDSMAKLYASWEVDFLKVDCISSPYKDQEIQMLSRALARSGRTILLSLSPGPTPLEKADDVSKYAQMWRISGDFWDLWSHAPDVEGPQGLRAQFDLIAAWALHSAPGHWPDADMLPIGHLGPSPGLKPERESRFTSDEARTLLTLWSISRSPLIIGSNLPRMDRSTEELLTNPEVLAVDQHSQNNHPVLTTATLVVWLARPQTGGGYYLGVFNISDIQQRVEAPWKELSLMDPSYKVRDLWTHTNLANAKSLSVMLKPHASVLYRLMTP